MAKMSINGQNCPNLVKFDLWVIETRVSFETTSYLSCETDIVFIMLRFLGIDLGANPLKGPHFHEIGLGPNFYKLST